jgi:anthranilate/para-aminobenzoate synthase component II
VFELGPDAQATQMAFDTAPGTALCLHHQIILKFAGGTASHWFPHPCHGKRYVIRFRIERSCLVPIGH